MRNIIIIGPPERVRELVRAARAENVVPFSSLLEFDRWREAQVGDETFGPDLIALDELGCPLATLPVRLRRQIAALASETRVPPLSALTRAWPSRRSFYRVWGESIGDTPSAFLRRLRALHAKRLIAMGRSKKEAAFHAGFSSVEQMRRNLLK